MSRRPINPVTVLAVGAGAAFAAATILRRMRRFEFKDASVVITGGSRGLGLELARCFVREGARVSLLARDPDELARARAELVEQGGDVAVYHCDVRRRDEVEDAVAKVVRDRGGIDVLVNNAGIVQVGPVENMTVQDFEDAMAVHAWGPLFTMNAVLPHMKERKKGRIVNISSIGGLIAVPHLVPYSMSKFALTGLSDGMRAELARYGIRVTTVAPGLMRTGSPVNALFKGQYRKEFAWFAVTDANPLVTAAAHRAAKQIVEACRYGDARLIITFPAKMLHLVNALLPGFTAACSSLATRLLPGPVAGGEAVHKGKESESSLAPSWLTTLSDRAAVRNNEVGG